MRFGVTLHGAWFFNAVFTMEAFVLTQKTYWFSWVRASRSTAVLHVALCPPMPRYFDLLAGVGLRPRLGGVLLHDSISGREAELQPALFFDPAGHWPVGPQTAVHGARPHEARHGPTARVAGRYAAFPIVAHVSRQVVPVTESGDYVQVLQGFAGARLRERR